jgi:hypothetical protein
MHALTTERPDTIVITPTLRALLLRRKALVIDLRATHAVMARPARTPAMRDARTHFAQAAADIEFELANITTAIVERIDAIA